MKKNIKIVISISLAVIIITMTIFPAFSVSTNNSKLSDELISAINNASDTDIIPIYVFLKESDQNKVKEIMREEYSQDVEIYENEERFYSEIAPNIKIGNKKISEITNNTKITAETFNFNSKNTLNIEEKKEINKAIQNEFNKYLKNKRNSISLVVDDYLTAFCESANIENNDIKFKSRYLDFLIVNCTKREITELSNNSQVEQLSLYKNENPTSAQWSTVPIISADSYSGIGGSSFNNGSGYDGTGITIGIIEASYGKYKENDYNLNTAHNNNLFYVQTNNIVGNPGNHATNVTAIICGKKTTIDGKTYEGIATGATILQTGTYSWQDLYDAVELLTTPSQLSESGANIINYSAGLNFTTGYDAPDMIIDDYIERLNVSFVTVSGNDGVDVASPGKAYNAITVGNLQTKSGNNKLASPYNLADGSRYNSDNYLSNKPDVVAPGCDIYLPTSATVVANKGSGTSYSAPLVTGMAAQLMQENPMYKVNPNALKNIIVCGASNAKITGTTTSYGKLQDESGAGLVNAINSLNAMDNVYYEAYLASSTTGVYDTIADVYIKKGQTIRIALTFEKEEYIDLTTYYGNNIDIRLAQTAGYAVHAKSESLKDNVEIIEFKATSSGTYNIQTRLTSSILTASGNNDLHYWVSWYIY